MRQKEMSPHISAPQERDWETATGLANFPVVEHGTTPDNCMGAA